MPRGSGVPKDGRIIPSVRQAVNWAGLGPMLTEVGGQWAVRQSGLPGLKRLPNAWWRNIGQKDIYSAIRPLKPPGPDIKNADCPSRQGLIFGASIYQFARWATGVWGVSRQR